MLNKFRFGSLPLTELPGLGPCDLKRNPQKNHLQNGQSVEGATESGTLACSSEQSRTLPKRGELLVVAGMMGGGELKGLGEGERSKGILRSLGADK